MTGTRGTNRARRWISGAALCLLAAACVAAVLVGLLYATGHRVLIVRSGSMEPAIQAGDLVVTELVRPGEFRVGDVVTFRDPTREGELVTHRVREMEARGEEYAFVTSGDANTGEERWQVPADGTVGRFRARIPGAGYVFAWIGFGPVRAGVLSAGALLLAVVGLRRVWRWGDATPAG